MTMIKQRQVARDFLEMKKGLIFDGITARRRMFDEWGINIDWHIFTEVMDEMTRCGLARVVDSKTGRTNFFIEPSIRSE